MLRLFHISIRLFPYCFMHFLFFFFFNSLCFEKMNTILIKTTYRSKSLGLNFISLYQRSSFLFFISIHFPIFIFIFIFFIYYLNKNSLIDFSSIAIKSNCLNQPSRFIKRSYPFQTYVHFSKYATVSTVQATTGTDEKNPEVTVDGEVKWKAIEPPSVLGHIPLYLELSKAKLSALVVLTAMVFFSLLFLFDFFFFFF